jgi:hypothetical protein
VVPAFERVAVATHVAFILGLEGINVLGLRGQAQLAGRDKLVSSALGFSPGIKPVAKLNAVVDEGL